MSVFSVPVTIGVDEKAIVERIEENVEEQVLNNITTEIKEKIFKKASYYDSNTPLENLVRFEAEKLLRKNEDEIIQIAARMLADKLIKTKAVKEVAAETAKKALK